MGRGVLLLLAVAVALVGLSSAAQAVPPGRPGLIAFDNFNVDGESYDIFVVSENGTGLRNVTRTTTLDEYDPSWSPDARRIAFAAAEAGDMFTSIFVMNSDGSSRTRLVRGGVWQRSPAWSPDGRRIAFSQCTDLVEGDCSHARIVVVGADGRGLRAVSRPSQTEWMVDEKPAWSPDGRSIAFTRTPSFAMNTIWVVAADGARQRRILDDGSAAEHSPSWSPDNRLLAYATDFLGPDAIFVVRSDGRLRKRVVVQKPLSPEDAGGTAQSPAFAPSGSRIAVTFDGDIWTMNRSGGSRRRVTRDGGDNADWGRAG
jgi:TolB protein